MRTVLVTGAGHGLGEAIARLAAARGARVGVLDLDGEAAAAVAADLPGAVALQADTTDESAVVSALDELGDVPDGVVCNAGIVRFSPLRELELADWRAVVDVNLTGTFVTARAAARRMMDAGERGAIVSIASMNGVAPGPNAGAYAATKAGVIMLTQQMALEWGAHGIRCNAVAPGMIDAGMSTPIFADLEFRQRRESKVPLGRLGTAEDIAHATVWLLGDESAYVTGQTLLVDGGVTMSIIAHLPRPASVDTVGAAGSD
jgi:NAD(P)-dependent dehydrogenase (short-subunit alcohol dehydrogenase family)